MAWAMAMKTGSLLVLPLLEPCQRCWGANWSSSSGGLDPYRGVVTVTLSACQEGPYPGPPSQLGMTFFECVPVWLGGAWPDVTQTRQGSSLLRDGFGSQTYLQIQTVLLTSYSTLLRTFICTKGGSGNTIGLAQKTHFLFSPITLLIWVFWVGWLFPMWYNIDRSQLMAWFDLYQLQLAYLTIEQGCQIHLHWGPHQPAGCLQRAECNFRTV